MPYFTLAKALAIEVAQKATETYIGKELPKNMVMYGKIRITNGFENKIILPNDTIPDGWTRGMAKRGKK